MTVVVIAAIHFNLFVLLTRSGFVTRIPDYRSSRMNLLLTILLCRSFMLINNFKLRKEPCGCAVDEKMHLELLYSTY